MRASLGLGSAEWLTKRNRSDMAKRPRDLAQLAKQVFDIAIGEAEDTVSEAKRHPSKRRIGGDARAKSLTAQQRRAIAKAAADARWKTKT